MVVQEEGPGLYSYLEGLPWPHRQAAGRRRQTKPQSTETSLLLCSHGHDRLKIVSRRTDTFSTPGATHDDYADLDFHIIICFTLNFSYRGYYSRRWEHDFYARKKYLQYVETKNEEVRRNLDEHNRGIA